MPKNTSHRERQESRRKSHTNNQTRLLLHQKLPPTMLTRNPPQLPLPHRRQNTTTPLVSNTVPSQQMTARSSPQEPTSHYLP